MPLAESGVVVQGATRRQSVRMHHQDGTGWPGIREFLNAAHVVAGGTVLRNGAAGLAVQDDGAADIAETRKTHRLLVAIDLRHRDGGTACRPQRLVNAAEDLPRGSG